MIRYCYKRILLAVPVMIGISLLAFILGLLSPGDPAEFALNQDGLDAPTDAQIAAMREELGLNRPIYVQYFSWIKTDNIRLMISCKN
jgi:peptide/nickel transport system permease protein